MFRKVIPVLANLTSLSGAPPGWQEPEFQDEKLTVRPEWGRLLICSGRYPAEKEEETENQGGHRDPSYQKKPHPECKAVALNYI